VTDVRALHHDFVERELFAVSIREGDIEGQPFGDVVVRERMIDVFYQFTGRHVQ
jgi:hypothetical protein